jgi:hypothetical protein
VLEAMRTTAETSGIARARIFSAVVACLVNDDQWFEVSVHAGGVDADATRVRI